MIKRLVLWLLSGAALVLGGYLAALALGVSPGKPHNYVEYPTDLKIYDLKASPLTHSFTVVGRITNSSSRTYRPIFVDLEVHRGDSLLLRCRQSDMSYVPPKSSIGFQMSCPDVVPQRVPKDATFSAIVNSASYK
jgi:hypothetical protein